MCGQENKKMSVQETVEELAQVCSNIRYSFKSATDQEREKIAFKHIKEYADRGVRVNDFQKGLEWFNVSEGLSVHKHLAGKITVLDFFTYCCINCMHILPDLDALERKFSIENGVVVIGVHSAKFENERDSNKILSAVQRYNIAHPVVNDAKLSMWRDIGIYCWPSLVVLGPKGQPLFVMVGEGRREELFVYVKAALDYFKTRGEITDHSLPLKPAQHLLPKSKDVLLFPGKVHCFRSKLGERIALSDTGNNRILIMDVEGKVEHVIGGYSPGFKDGNFNEARFSAPQGVCSLDDCLFVADNENHAIRKVDLTSENVSTVAGNGSQGRDYEGGKFGHLDQPLSSPWDVAIYQHDQNEQTVPILLIAIAGTHQIWALFLEDTIWWKRKEYKAGTCIAIVGNGREENRNNSYPHAAALAQPSGLTIAQDLKSIFFADSESSSIRRVHLQDGKVSGVCGASKDPSDLHNFGDVDGKQIAAKLQHPLGVAWDHVRGLVYVADTYNHKIKKVDPEGNCVTLYGAGKPNDNHKFDEPSGLAVSLNGNTLYVADTNNHAVKAIDIKDETIHEIQIKLSEETENYSEGTYNFNSSINKNGGILTISFAVEFSDSDGLKLNSDAPQKWSLVLPKDTWKANSTTGNLKTPISLEIPKGETENKLRVNLDVVVCKTNECIPKRLFVAFNVSQTSDAPTEVSERKVLKIK